MVEISIGGRLALAAVLILAYFYVQKRVKESGREEEVRSMEWKVRTIFAIIALLALVIGGLYSSWYISSFSW